LDSSIIEPFEISPLLGSLKLIIWDIGLAIFGLLACFWITLLLKPHVGSPFGCQLFANFPYHSQSLKSKAKGVPGLNRGLKALRG